LEKPRTFSCIDHSAPKGEIKMAVDIHPILDALRGIERALGALNLSPKISVESPIIDINVPTPQVTVNVPEQKTPQVTVAVPEVIPQITVAPAEVVFQTPESMGNPIPAARPERESDFDFYAKTAVFVGLSIPLIMTIELVLKLMKILP